MLSYLLAGLFFVVTLFWIFYFYRHDKDKKEPKNKVIVAFFSSILASALSAFFESIAWIVSKHALGFSQIDYINHLKTIHTVRTLFLLIPEITVNASIEEILKFLMLYLFFYKKRFFNRVSDGIFFGVIIGLGFAFFEDLLYLNGDGPTVWVRAFFILFHPTTIGIVGYFLAKHKILRTSKRSVYLALLAVSLLHAAHNWLLLWREDWSTILFFGLLAFLYGELFILYYQSQKMTPLICIYCGHMNHSLDSFCIRCGKRLESSKITSSD